MTTTRRLLVLLALTVVAVLGSGATAANATFSDSAALPAMTVGTATVAPATDVRISTRCETTTTVTRRVYNVDWAGIRTLAYTERVQYVDRNADADVDDTQRNWSNGPDRNQVTETTTDRDTELFATLRWKASTAARVSGYRVTAHFWGTQLVIDQTGATATQLTAQYDAEVVGYGARVSIDTLTSYGWTATSALTAPVTC